MATKLTIKQTKFVAAYLGPANGNATEAARQAGYAGTDETLRSVGAENLTKPNIAEAIDAARAAIRAEGIAVKQFRIDAQEGRWRDLETIRAERGADPKLRTFPGGSTGFITATLKQVKHVKPGGEDAEEQVWTEEFWEHAFDQALFNAYLNIEKHVAQEMGQWSEKLNVSGAITFADLHALAATGASADHSRPGE